MGVTGRNSTETVKKWKATIWYPRANGFEEEVEIFVDEIADVHDFVESGDNFFSISRIEIVLNDDFAVQLGYRRVAK